MGRYILGRFGQMLVVLPLASLTIFIMMRSVPGDPAMVFAGPDASPQVVAAVRQRMGLDQPLPLQYVLWMGRVLQGDLGRSYVSGFPVADLLARRLPATVLLAVSAILVALVIAVPSGIIAAVRQGSWVDYLVTTANGLVLAIPGFWLGLVLILTLAVGLRWLPASGYVNPATDPVASVRHLVLPMLTLAVSVAGVLSRYMKAVSLDVLQTDYVRTARSKGLPERLVLRRHVISNAMVTFVTVLGLQLGRLLGGAVLIESVFAWPGVGLLVLDAVNSRDYLVVQGGLLFFVLLFMAINLLTDLAYGVLDPRVRLS